MKTIKVYEFKDLSKDVKNKLLDKFTNAQVEADIRTMFEDFNAGLFGEKELYKVLGCSKSYADSTPWFIPESYYENNKQSVDEDVKDTLSQALFTKFGKFIQYKE